MTRRSRRRALSLVEVLIGAVIIGVSAIPVLELVRSGTSRLEVTEIEVAARQVGSDLLERVAGPGLGVDKGLTDAFKALINQQFSWSQLLKEDKSLARAFPAAALNPLLELADVRVRLQVESPFEHPTLGKLEDLEAYSVTVTWNDRDVRKQVTFARLVDR